MTIINVLATVASSCICRSIHSLLCLMQSSFFRLAVCATFNNVLISSPPLSPPQLSLFLPYELAEHVWNGLQLIPGGGTPREISLNNLASYVVGGFCN